MRHHTQLDTELQSDDGNITCYFLPPNTTPLIQPMDQSVIETLKRRYRKTFIQELVCEEGETSLKEFWKGYNLKMVIDNVSDAWTEMSADTLKRSWNKLWPDSNDVHSSEINDNVAITSEIMAATSTALGLEVDEINEWLRCDVADTGSQILTDDEIVQQVNEEDVDSESEYDGTELTEATPKAVDLRMEAKEAASHMQHFIEWYERQPEANHLQTMLLRKFRKLAADKSVATLKQMKLTDIFAKKN